VKSFDDGALKAMTMDEASHILRIPRHTLRFWEKEFDVFFSSASPQGRQRRYGPEEISLIEMIRRLRNRGRSVSDIKRELQQGNGGGSGRAAGEVASTISNSGSPRQL
jgi:DNA-binding transcriptional MerR regulator